MDNAMKPGIPKNMTYAVPDQHEQFMRLLAKHEPVVRAYVRTGVYSAQDVAEVMQDISVVAWRKFDQLEDHSGFGKWMTMIARYEIMKFRQTKARDRLVLDDEIIDKILQEGGEETSIREAWIEAIEGCLAKLPPRHRTLLLEAYEPGSSIKNLAARTKKNPNSLYQTLHRLRGRIANCIESEMGHE